jgi:hypothetical protein
MKWGPAFKILSIKVCSLIHKESNHLKLYPEAFSIRIARWCGVVCSCCHIAITYSLLESPVRFHGSFDRTADADERKRSNLDVIEKGQTVDVVNENQS